MQNKELPATLFFKIYFWPHHAACGILAPCPGIEPAPSALEAQSLNHWTTREVPLLSLSVVFPSHIAFNKLVKWKSHPQDFTHFYFACYLHICSQTPRPYPALLCISSDRSLQTKAPLRTGFWFSLVNRGPLQECGRLEFGRKPGYFSPTLSAPGCVSNSDFMSSVIPALDDFLLYGLSAYWVVLPLGFWGHYLFLLSLQPWGPWEVPTVLLAG